MIKIVNDVLTQKDCFDLYRNIVNQNFWTLSRTSSSDNLGGAFPGVSFIEKGSITYEEPYWIGYFTCLFDRINQKLLEQHNFSINKNINRIALNAANDNHYTEFHVDQDSDYYTIVGFLTPQWAEDWGGELNVEGQIIKYKPGDFVIFDSNIPHKSEPIKKIPYWRTSIAYAIKKS
tara:strand:+ start:372 stop:899 length:528 start_codon:yes stop_codon:yes gene_type:complete